MAFIPGTLVKADETLNRAVQNALSETFYKIGERKEPGYHRSALNNPIVSGGGSVAGYQGYFTIVDATDDDGPKVKVTDPRAEPAWVSMPCKVNAIGFTLREWTSDVMDKRYTYIYLHFNGEDGGSVAVEASDEQLEDEGVNVYYLIGRVRISEDGAMTILQDHCSGVPQLLWFYSWCPGDDDEDAEE